MIQVFDIHKRFGDLEVLKGVSLRVARGEVVSVVGASGAGKTTLLQILGTLLRPDSGRVEIDGREPFALGDRELSSFRNERIGFVFQFHHLLPEFTAFENVCIPGFIGQRPRAEVERRAAELIALLGLAARRDHKPAQLSGGEQQRVSIARAMAKNPKLLLCDEPTGALDYATGKKILKLLHDVSKQRERLVIIVTHNSALKDMADKVIYIKSGRIEKIETNANPLPIEEIEW